MSAEMNNIREIIRLASTNNGFISIKGYESSSSGQVANFLVQPLGKDGYEKMIRKAMLEAPLMKRPSEYDEELWAKAQEGQMKSWQKTLDGEIRRKNNYVKEEKAFYGHADNDAVYIKNFVTVKKEVTTQGVFKKVNSAALTLAKKYIRNQSCLKKYGATLKLEIGKFESVKYKGVTIIG